VPKPQISMFECYQNRTEHNYIRHNAYTTHISKSHLKNIGWNENTSISLKYIMTYIQYVTNAGD